MSKSTQYSTPTLTPEQKAQIASQTEFFTGTIAPTYTGAVRGATDVYNINAPGVLRAGQNLAGTALQTQQALGETGESALRTGITGLQTLFDPNYEARQVAAALAPAQAQYEQNMEMQRRALAGSGNLGSARAALAAGQMAGAAQGQQMQTAAAIQQGIAAQRAQAASQLAQLGQGGLGQALGAAGQVVTAAYTPQDLYNKYASVIFGTPSTSYTPNFAGTQGQRVDSSGINLTDAVKPLAGAAGAALFSDIRLKENVKQIKTEQGLPVYKFNYVWDKTPRVGVMAQDLLADDRYKDTVSVHKSGYYQVDYSKLPAGVTEEK